MTSLEQILDRLGSGIRSMIGYGTAVGKTAQSGLTLIKKLKASF
jgi:hypothetical protein